MDFFGQNLGRLQVRSVIGDMLFDRVGLRSPFSLGQQSSAAVAGDRQNPRLNRAVGIPMIQAADHAHESLLGHVLRLVVLTDHAETERIHFVSKQVDELPYGGTIPLTALID